MTGRAVRPLTVAFVEGLGLNQNDILLDGIDDRGYYKISRHPDGKRMFSGAEVVSVFTKWPVDGAGEIVMSLLALDDRMAGE